MSAVLVRRALEVALAAMTPALATAYENAPFTPPAPNVPYQQVWLLFATPENREIGGTSYTERGLMQVDLRYPLNAGPKAASDRAELLRSTFNWGASFTASGVTVHINGTPEITPGRSEDDRWVVRVRVPFHANIRS